MNKAILKKIWSQVKHYTIVMAKGLVKTLHGALVACMIVAAVYGYIAIESEAGYVAVADFLASSALVSVVMMNLYWMGMKKVKK